ncbi:hypothetical protein yc1106_03294 [Curvularia clavata]|uniref:DUF2293 domain-containing protein n=1 Tax=Curvularia clavata TaxID=95742 RepID=A0A9Q8Z5G5_CURCL|nr:hypothetical protein yc1106_03294 [Curvularia clavata]
MTRVHQARLPYGPQRGHMLEQTRAVPRKKKPYKVVLEAVTQEKRRLHSILTYTSNAPTGFGFIPAGYPEFTEWCKEQCRQRNLDVHIVSVTRKHGLTNSQAKPKNKMHSNPEKLSHHVHRVGHHFPMEIISLACSKFGYTYDETSGLRKVKDDGDRNDWIARRFEDYSSRQAGQGQPTTEKETKSYVDGAIRDLFPKIPDDDLQAIVDHAFEEGTNRVGNAKGLSLARKVQLAVVAHIRHTYTDYDKLLKSGGWSEARSKVESVTLAKLKEWRDEADEQTHELEETFREVIVLDDEDDDDEASSDTRSLSTPDEREQSMEIVYSRATARDLQPELHANSPRNDVRVASGRTIISQRYPAPPRQSFLPASPHSEPFLQLPPSSVRASLNSESRLGSHSAIVEAYRHGTFGPVERRTRPLDPGLSARVTQPIMHEMDGRLYRLQPIKEPRDDSMMRYDLPPPVPRRIQEAYSLPTSPRFSTQPRPPTNTRRITDQDAVLPSVERETVDLTSPRGNTNGHHPVQNHSALDKQKRKASDSFAYDREPKAEQYTKRPRPMYREEVFPRIYPGGPHEFRSSPLMGPHSIPRPPPPEHVVNPRSSPNGPSLVQSKDYYTPSRPIADVDPRGYGYAPTVPQHGLPTRGPRYQVPADEPYRAYMPNVRAYDSRAPGHEYILSRDGRRPSRNEEENLPYSRTGARYGA